MKCVFEQIDTTVNGRIVSHCVHCGAIIKSRHKPEHIHRACDSEQPFAFGNLVESIIHRLGFGWCGKFYEWATGRPCGCQKRKAWLNKWIRIK